MTSLIGILAALALLVWVISRVAGRSTRPPAAIDRDELEAAERELAEDAAPRALDSGEDEQDDWGPGATGR